MKLKLLLLLIFYHLGFFPGLYSQKNEALRLSVKQARDYALVNNRSVQSAKIDIRLADRKIKENLASGLPQVNIDANYLHQFVVPEISFGPFLDTDALPSGPLTGQDIRNAYVDSPTIPLGVMDNTVIDFTLSQLVFNGQYFVALKTARIVREVSEKSLIRTEDQVKEDVAVSYYSILVMQESLRLLNETHESLNKMYDEIAWMNQLGLNEETDVDQVNVNRSNVRALISTMESQVEIAIKQLKYLLGIDYNQSVELTDSLSGIIEEGNLMYLSKSEFDISNSVDYQLVDIQEKVSEQLLRLEKAKYFPVISAFYRHQEQTNQPAFNFAVKDVVGATLNLPLFTSGIRSSKVSQAKYELHKAGLNKQNVELSLIMEYETAKSNYQSAHRNYMINRESMDLSQKIYDRTVIKYREGVSSSFELMQIQNQFLTAESNYYNSLLTLLRSKAELDRILRSN